MDSQHQQQSTVPQNMTNYNTIENKPPTYTELQPVTLEQLQLQQPFKFQLPNVEQLQQSLHLQPTSTTTTNPFIETHVPQLASMQQLVQQIPNNPSVEYLSSRPAAPSNNGLFEFKLFYHVQRALFGNFYKQCRNCWDINYKNKQKFQVSADEQFLTSYILTCKSCAINNIQKSIQDQAQKRLAAQYHNNKTFTQQQQTQFQPIFTSAAPVPQQQQQPTFF
jgi:hypothetical protein